MTQTNPPNQDPWNIEPLLTVDDLARILKRSARTIRYWRSSGLLPEPDVAIERTVRWRSETIQTWLDNGARPNG